MIDSIFDGLGCPGGAIPNMFVSSIADNYAMTSILKKGIQQPNSTQQILINSSQYAKDQYWVQRQSIIQMVDNQYALWRPKKSKSMNQKTFEELKSAADGNTSLGQTLKSSLASVASVGGKYFGSLIGASSNQELS